MKNPTSRPVVLCLSGHDPSGGAGLQADIEALLAQACHAAPTVTALTVQDTVNVTDFRVLDREWVLAQANPRWRLGAWLVWCRSRASAKERSMLMFLWDAP